MKGLNEESQEVMDELNTDLALTEDRPRTEKKPLRNIYTYCLHVIRETIKIDKQPYSFNSEDGYKLS
jgi:hypothetical protein